MPTGLVEKKGVKIFSMSSREMPPPFILHPDHRLPVLCAAIHLKLPAACGSVLVHHGVNGVVNKVEQHLLKLRWIGVDLYWGGLGLEGQGNAVQLSLSGDHMRNFGGGFRTDQ